MKHSLSHLGLTAIALALATLTPAIAVAQATLVETPREREIDPAVDEITTDVVDARKKSAEESTDLDEEAKKKTLNLYRQTAEQLRNSQTFEGRVVEFKSRTENADDSAATTNRNLQEVKTELDAAKQRLERSQSQLADSDFVPAAELSELEKKRTSNEQELKKLRDLLTKIEAESANRANRRKEVRARLANAETELVEIDKALAGKPPTGEHALLSLAKRTELLARKKAITKERSALESELVAYDAEDAVDKLQLDRDLTTQQVALAALELQISELLLKRKNDKLAQDAVLTAEHEANQVTSPANRSLAARNLQLAKKHRKVTKDMTTVEAERKNLQTELEELRRQFEVTKKKVDSVGLPASVGALLRKQRKSLPDIRAHQAAVEERQPTIDAAQLELFDLDDVRTQLADIDAEVQQHLILNLTDQVTSEERELARREAKALLERKASYLNPLIRSQNSYFDALAELSITEQQLIQLSKQFAEYIDQRVLWIRSGQPLSVKLDVTKSVSWLFNARHWKAVGRGLMADVQSQPLGYVLFLGIVLAISRFTVRLRRRICDIGEQVQRSTFSQFLPTVHAALLTVVVSILWPALMAFVGWRLGAIANGDEFIAGLASGMYFLAGAYLFPELLRQSCRPNGLATAHFQWPEMSVKLLRGSLRSLMLLGLPIVVVITMLQAGDPSPGRNSLERLCFIAGTVLVSVVIARVLHPRHGVFHVYLALHPEGWSSRLRYIWYAVAITLPLVLGGLALLGYYYTAQQLAWRVYISVVFVAALLAVNGFVRRLLMVHRRRLSIEQARQRRAEPMADVESGPEATYVPSDMPAWEEPLADLNVQTSQAGRLVATLLIGTAFVGIWLIWVDVLPALHFLEQWPLWESTTQITETITNDAGDLQIRTREAITPITIADVIFAFLIAGVTLIAAKNLPGLLEISVLQRLPLEASIRYAVTTLCSYAIILVGLIAACNAIGLRWSQIQWMATALTFGLAFGLQEMFANFVAGIIILFERPIRVGDIVTVDEISGVVSRVRIRATTITNWDRKDFVVPNKDFITGRVLNWTLSDQVSRIVINVGVAYGSDTTKAKDLLLKIATEHALVVHEPAPSATFEEFGESSLTLVLRCFIAMRDMSSRLRIIDDLHSSIAEEFKQANIEIAFPQRDLHIRSFTPTVGLESRNGALPGGLKLAKD